MDRVPRPNGLFASLTAAPNGFINVRLADAALANSVAAVALGGVRPPPLPPRRVLVDFSSPNIAKEMHVGHLRSTILGDAICRVLEFCSLDVMRVNHVGDWGTQFGMLIQYLTETYPDLLTQPPSISDLTALYKASKRRFDEDDAFKEAARGKVVALQAGDPTCRAVWRQLCEISRAEFQRVYDLLGVRLCETGESFYNSMIPGVIDELRGAGLVQEDEGMLLVRPAGFELPLIMRKSDGGFGYDSTDMAALRYRLRDLERDWVIIVTDAGQAGHFQLCFAAAREAGWVLPHHRVDHIGFGVVQGEDGKRFKTRSSETVRLVDLLDAARDRMAVSLAARASEGKSTLAGETLMAAARAAGYGSVKYFDLKQHPATSYQFNYDRMLDMRGDTAVYLLFAYARLASILRKAREERGLEAAALAQCGGAEAVLLAHPSERALAFELLQFGDAVASVVRDLLPHRLCDFLKEVCVRFSDFVTRCHVLNPETPEAGKSRLLLCEATRAVMAKSFELLGIEPLERI